MRQNLCNRLEKLERISAAARQAEAYRNAPSGAEVLQTLLNQYAIERRAGESGAETLARGLGVSTMELKELLCERAEAGERELDHPVEWSMRRQ